MFFLLAAKAFSALMFVVMSKTIGMIMKWFIREPNKGLPYHHAHVERALLCASALFMAVLSFLSSTYDWVDMILVSCNVTMLITLAMDTTPHNCGTFCLGMSILLPMNFLLAIRCGA